MVEPGWLNEICGPLVAVGTRISVGRTVISLLGTSAESPAPMSVGVEVKVGTTVLVCVWPGASDMGGSKVISVGEGGGGIVGVTSSAITSFMEQADNIKIRARLEIIFFISAYSWDQHTYDHPESLKPAHIISTSRKEKEHPKIGERAYARSPIFGPLPAISWFTDYTRRGLQSRNACGKCKTFMRLTRI
jgi:hypothetical protein